MFNAGNTQAAKTNDARAEQRGDMHVIQTGRQRKSEVRARQGIFGIASIYGISSEGRPITEILQSVTAVPAIAIYATHPGNTGSGSQRQLRGRTLNHLSDNLMARNELRFKRRQVPFNDVQVGTTDPAGNHPKQDMPGFKLWTRDILHLKERPRRLADR